MKLRRASLHCLKGTLDAVRQFFCTTFNVSLRSHELRATAVVIRTERSPFLSRNRFHQNLLHLYMKLKSLVRSLPEAAMENCPRQLRPILRDKRTQGDGSARPSPDPRPKPESLPSSATLRLFGTTSFPLVASRCSQTIFETFLVSTLFLYGLYRWVYLLSVL